MSRCNSEKDVISPLIDNTKEVDSIPTNLSSDKDFAMFELMSNKLVIKTNKRLNSLTKEEKKKHFENLKKFSASKNYSALIKEMGFSNNDEYISIITGLKSSYINMLNKYPLLSHLNDEQIVQILIDAKNDSNSTKILSCYSEYSACLSRSEKVYVVAVAGCAATSAAPILAAGCLWVASEWYDHDRYSCIYDRVNCDLERVEPAN
ncbi:hypothetical protein [Pontibacter arcticus]|uniref:Uncharacterized protein n=1 Tax=Pontibacter arcticus TaxID=2080288 RepID=A0A364RGP9_9BACT|nr:hypothetical protein [Pontibacter arcticus]RAU83520.1 hypothetical protein DP923_00085 [Pontibacter arcticus]